MNPNVLSKNTLSDVFLKRGQLVFFNQNRVNM